MSMQMTICPTCDIKVCINSSGKCPSCRSEMAPLGEAGQSNQSKQGVGDSAEVISEAAKWGVWLGRLSIVCAILGILGPFPVVMMQLGLGTAGQLSFMFAVLAAALGIAAVPCILISKKSIVVRSITCGLIAGLVVANGFVWSAIDQTVDAFQNMHMNNKVKQLLLAAHNYHDEHGYFPTDIVDEDGTPILSWRVAILPYLLEEDLYRKFRLDEPWDSEHNLTLLNSLPSTFARPGSDAAPGKCVVERVFGKGTSFQSLTSRIGFSDLLGPASEQLFLVEVASERARPWTQPGGFDLGSDEAESLLPSNTPLKQILVGFADGSTNRSSKSELSETIRSLKK